MFEYDQLHRIRSAEFIREAERHALARQARRGARSAHDTPERPPYGHRFRRQRLARPA